MTTRTSSDSALTIVVPQVAGSLNDLFARAFAPGLGAVLGRAVNVENRAGAQGVAGAEYVARQAPADGATIVMTSINNLVSFSVFGKAGGIDPLRELTPVIVFAESRLLLGSGPRQPWRTFEEFRAHAQTHPGVLRYGASSESNHLSTEVMLHELGLNMSYVPFDSTTLYQKAIAAGDPHMGLMPELAATGWGERIRYIAQTGQRRSEVFPEVPTFSDIGLPQIKGVKYALSVRAGTSTALIAELSAAVSQVVQKPHVKAGLGKFLMELNAQTPQQASEMLMEHARAVSLITGRMSASRG